MSTISQPVKLYASPLYEQSFNTEEYEFGTPCYPNIPTGFEYRLTISRHKSMSSRIFFVVVARGSAGDVVPIPVPDYMAVDATNFSSYTLGDTGASLFETYEEAAEHHRLISKKLISEIKLIYNHRTAAAVELDRMFMCRSCVRTSPWAKDSDGSQIPEPANGMVNARVKPWAYYDEADCEADCQDYIKDDLSV